jgi:hypothetical protein
MSKWNFNSKTYVGVGAASILAGAVFLSLDSRGSSLYLYICVILFGISSILSGISYVLGGRGQQATGRLSLLFLGAALAFMSMHLASQ